jgi:hypothetical protein
VLAALLFVLVVRNCVGDNPDGPLRATDVVQRLRADGDGRISSVACTATGTVHSWRPADPKGQSQGSPGIDPVQRGIDHSSGRVRLTPKNAVVDVAQKRKGSIDGEPQVQRPRRIR